ncbi:hypothetical protein PENDEC_c009G06167 [Penicillium decumbens]|uniref:Uncharacterized protein n=1 Tax=Penicillium decumbens TaxID=69771 RepID=A0A1V6PCZ8_PENDC|nr:hypothetical protein PENDEC_c009G06167 [Penicillium decumbens]
MSHSSNPTASHKEAHLTLRELEPPLPELDDMNEDLLPIQLSAQNTPTAVRLWPQIEELIKPNLRGHYPDLLNITDVNPRLATQLHRRIEQVGPKAVRSSFDTTTGCFTIKMPTPVHNCVCQWSIDSIVEWRVTGLITAAEKNILNFTVADRLELPNGSNKEPDGLWVVDGLDYPTI